MYNEANKNNKDDIIIILYRKPQNIKNEDENNKEINNLFMWKSISFSQIKDYPKLNFVINKVNKSMPKIEIFVNRTIASGNENAYSNLGSKICIK